MELKEEDEEAEKIAPLHGGYWHENWKPSSFWPWTLGAFQRTQKVVFESEDKKKLVYIAIDHPLFLSRAELKPHIRWMDFAHSVPSPKRYADVELCRTVGDLELSEKVV